MVVIATWNLENLFRPGDPNGPKDEGTYKAKLTAQAHTIDAIAPDVLAVQEVGDPAALDDLVAELTGDWHVAVSQHPDAKVHPIRVGFISRHELTVVADTKLLPQGLSLIEVSDHPAAPSHELGRGALTVRVEPVAGKPLTIITCHLKSKLLTFPGGRFSPHDEGERARFGAYALYRRSAEATAVRELATAVLAAGPDERLIVLGDLNDGPDAATTQILNGPTGSEIGTIGFKTPDGGDRQRLWNLAPAIPEAERYSRVYRGRHELIDHIFVSHALVNPLPQAHTHPGAGLPSITDQPGQQSAGIGSDHSPVAATLDL